VVQVTTFRSERGYSDARRPDQVEFGRSPEEDARRRDFTCNALFLDPLDDRLLDPTGGLADLERGVLRCVGEPRERFREDGLRLVRMARFAAAFGLAVEPETLRAARECVGSLSGVSGERLLLELQAIFERPDAGAALRLLETSGVLERALPEAGRAGDLEVRWRTLDELPQPVGPVAGFATLAAPAEPRDPRDPPDRSLAERVEAVLQPLRPSRELRHAVGEALELAGSIERFADEPQPQLSARLRAMRKEQWGTAVALARALRRARGLDVARIDELARFAASLGPGELRPRPWITSEDLERAGIPRGPRWRELLERAEALQLDGAWGSRADALGWLETRARGTS
jgi:tRNA nucleotidyltransferase/poly(A) polymerase